jgi:hypothetical protein
MDFIVSYCVCQSFSFLKTIFVSLGKKKFYESGPGFRHVNSVVVLQNLRLVTDYPYKQFPNLYLRENGSN